jgi:hypothetical protein
MPRETLFHHSYPERKLKLLPTHKIWAKNKAPGCCMFWVDFFFVYGRSICNLWFWSLIFFLCFKILYSLANCGNPSSKHAAYHIMTLPCMASSNIKCQTSLTWSRISYLDACTSMMPIHHMHMSTSDCHPCIGSSSSQTLMPNFYTNI